MNLKGWNVILLLLSLLAALGVTPSQFGQSTGDHLCLGSQYCSFTFMLFCAL
jgi:hypothetical protein